MASVDHPFETRGRITDMQVLESRWGSPESIAVDYPLETRFPDDVDWTVFESGWCSRLQQQCKVRNIPVDDNTSFDDVVRLLQEYQKKHVPTEVRKIPWRRSPDERIGEGFESKEMGATFQIAQAQQDQST